MDRVADGDAFANRWHERIRRATQLARTHAAASDVLHFYAGLATLQRSLVDAVRDAVRSSPLFVEALDCRVVADVAPHFTASVSDIAPAPLAAVARELAAEDSGAWHGRVDMYWRERPEPSDDMRAVVMEALLQPFAEAIARSRPIEPHECGGKPVVATLREAGHGARRSLVCGFCLTESATNRIECPSCGETKFAKLPVFRADELAAARIDACENCRTYMKTIDLTRDGTAVPIVDDIATVALDLWAREQGYRRLRPNLLRL